MSLEPPPRIVDKFVNIWRDWLYFFWEFVDSHTGGSSPTPPATGTSWNAHGSTAVGSSSEPLTVEPGAFVIKGGVGDTGYTWTGPGAETVFYWSPDHRIFRAGKVYTNEWDSIGAFGSFIAGSTCIGDDCVANVKDAVAIGKTVDVKSQSAVGLGLIVNIGTGALGAVAAGWNVDVGTGGIGSVALGASVTTGGLGSIGIGTDVTSPTTGQSIGQSIANSGGSGLCIGSYLENSGAAGGVIGFGVDALTPLVNAQDLTLVLGANSAAPTLILQNQRCGILETTPKSTLDVAGSVGYKYTPYTTADSPVTLTSSNNELVFFINPDSGNFNLTLPEISTAPRRMYHVKNTYVGGASGHQIRIIADTTVPDLVDSGIPAISPQPTLLVDPNRSFQIVADDSTNVWRII